MAMFSVIVVSLHNFFVIDLILTFHIVGVDDDVVDRYSLELQKLYSKLKPDDFDPISFYSMKDIFFHGDSINEIGHLLDFEIEHYLNTTIEPISESCRKLLISTCDTDSGKLKDDIRILNHPRLRLFRGFLKFMSEDLLLHPAAKSLSRKKYKKLVSKIAFEMIKVCIYGLFKKEYLILTCFRGMMLILTWLKLCFLLI